MKKKSNISIPKCSNCGREADLYSGAKNNQYYENLCERCIGNLGSSEFFRRWDRQNQRRTFAKDIIQPSDKAEYIRAYPEKARQYYSDEEFRKYG